MRILSTPISTGPVLRRCILLLAVLAAVAAAWQQLASSRAETGPAPVSENRPQAEAQECLAPVAVATIGARSLAVLGSLGRRLVILDLNSGAIRRVILLPAEGSGMAVRDGIAYVTTDEPAGRVLAVDLDRGRIDRQWRAGHMPTAPVLSRDGRTLFVANRFEDRVRAIDLETGTARTADVAREPVALALGPDGERLFVANHLPLVEPSLDDENPRIAAAVSVVDTGPMQVVRTIELPNGSHGLRGLALSPDGRYLAVTHILSNFAVPTVEIARGAMNRNALSLVRTGPLDLYATVILDDPERGAANPWGVSFTAAGDRLLVSHAGTHELSVIDWAALVDRESAWQGEESLFDDQSLGTMQGIRRRIDLPIAGARAVCEARGTVYVAGFFSDDVAAVDLQRAPPSVSRIEVGPRIALPPARRGEAYFNDATPCFQQWQSCATCHPDGRADALYWDLLNDGVGNTKNTKSLVMAALTPPVMWRGVRADAGMAVRSGIRHIQFVEPTPDEAEAIEQYLLAMKVVPSPALNADVLESPKTEDTSCAKCHWPGVARGTLSEAARRGKAIFEGKAGCVACHPHPYFTTMQTVDAGLGNGVAYDVPSLVEAWRSAPYLHNGDAMTLRQTITDFNFLHKRGKTNRLSPAELADLLEYLKSL